VRVSADADRRGRAAGRGGSTEAHEQREKGLGKDRGRLLFKKERLYLAEEEKQSKRGGRQSSLVLKGDRRADGEPCFG
jgi:hypothetical protein